MVAAKLASVHSMGARQRVGLNIQRIPRSRGFSHEELAARANVHRTYLSGVESGKRNPTVLVLARIATALETDLSDLIGRPQE